MPPEKLEEGINKSSDDPAVCIAEASAMSTLWAAGTILFDVEAAGAGSISTKVVIAHAMSDCLQEEGYIPCTAKKSSHLQDIRDKRCLGIPIWLFNETGLLDWYQLALLLLQH